MRMKYAAVAMLGTMLLLGAGIAGAEVYQPGEFLMLDLNQAALSPKPLGPPAQFEAVPVEAKADPVTAPVAKPVRAASARPHAVRRIARARSNPLDANAADTRVQVWPCRSGGICGWKK